MDFKFEYFDKNDIQVAEISDSLNPTAQGIFLTSYKGSLLWIESCDGFFSFNNGEQTVSTGNFKNAIDLLKEFIKNKLG